MAITVLTQKYATATFMLPLNKDESAYLLCKPILASKLHDISNKTMAEAGFDSQLAAQRMVYKLLEASIVGWAGLQDLGGREIPFSAENLRDICEADIEFVSQQLERIRRIAREARLEEEKN